MTSSFNNNKDKGLITGFYHRVGLSGPVTVVLGLGFLLLPLLPGEFPVIVGVEILILGLFAMSFNLIYGYMGQISFGHAAYFGLGAYGTALLFRAFQGGTGEIGYFDFFLSLLVAIPVSAVGALIVGFFCVRLTGVYFAIFSLAFGELIFYVVFSWYSFTGGDNGVQGLLPPPFFQNTVNYYYFTLTIVAVAIALLWRITRSPFGYTLRMLRDNQQRASFLGINVRMCMLMNFVIAGASWLGRVWLTCIHDTDRRRRFLRRTDGGICRLYHFKLLCHDVYRILAAYHWFHYPYSRIIRSWWPTLSYRQ